MDEKAFNTDAYEIVKISQILEKNKDKSFVKRILNPEQYPKLEMGDGKYKTHFMTWAESNGKYYVYPTVLYDGKKLIEFDPKAAFDNVMQTDNYIEFDNPEEAAWFSERYKAIWGD